MRFFLSLVALSLLSLGSASAQSTTIPPRPDRVAIVGDSLTRGLYATTEQQTFAYIVADGWGMGLGRYPVGTLGGAEKAFGTVSEWRPSIVVIELGINDVGKTSSAAWGIRYRTLVKKFQSNGSKVVAVTLFGVIWPGHARFTEWNEFNNQIRQSGADYIADAYIATVGCKACVSLSHESSMYPPHYTGDDFHPSNEGHRRIAQSIIESMPEPNETFYLPFLNF